jgi:hypothetical protein
MIGIHNLDFNYVTRDWVEELLARYIKQKNRWVAMEAAAQLSPHTSDGYLEIYRLILQSLEK